MSWFKAYAWMRDDKAAAEGKEEEEKQQQCLEEEEQQQLQEKEEEKKKFISVVQYKCYFMLTMLTNISPCMLFVLGATACRYYFNSTSVVFPL